MDKLLVRTGLIGAILTYDYSTEGYDKPLQGCLARIDYAAGHTLLIVNSGSLQQTLEMAFATQTLVTVDYGSSRFIHKAGHPLAIMRARIQASDDDEMHALNVIWTTKL